MKRRAMKFLIWALAGLLTFGSVLAQDKTSPGSKKLDRLKFKDIKWQVPEVGKDVTRLELSSGMILYLKEDHTLPLVNIQAVVRTGSVYEPAGKFGLASLTGTVMRSGGTKTLTPEEFNKKLEYMAGFIESSIDLEAGRASCSFLSKDVDEGLKLFADMLMNPAFRQDKLNLAKEQMKEQIRRKNDTPGSIINREFLKTVYGNHPYGRELDWQSVKKISRKDLMEFHRKYFKPNNLMLGITGDFDSRQMMQKIKTVFADWQPSPVDFPEVPGVGEAFQPGIYCVEKDINQTNLLLGHLGINQYNPDFFALTLMNWILGGGSFTSRLTSKVRSDEGLAYSVGSFFVTNTRDLGTFRASCQTKTESTCKALKYILEEIKKIRQSPVTDEELESARDAYINNFVFRFVTTEQQVGALMGLEYDKKPADYYKTYLNNIRKVNQEDILRVAKKYLKPDELTIYVVGNKEKFDKGLEDLGRVHTIALSTPDVD